MPSNKIILDINLDQANTILNALGEQPWRLANDLIIFLRQQVMEQIQQAQPKQVEDNIRQLAPGGVVEK